MTDSIPSTDPGLTPLDSLPIAYNNNGTITVMGHTFGPLTLADYAEVIESNVTVDEWLTDRQQDYNDQRDAIQALGDDEQARRRATSTLNIDKRRDDIELKRRVSAVLIDMLTRSDPQWDAPDNPPQWFGTYGIVHRIIQHWDSVPFRGLASTPVTTTASD